MNCESGSPWNQETLGLLLLYVVHPTLEYCNSAWRPSFVFDQRKIEKVQHRATRLLSPIRQNPYGKRLSILLLPSLAYRCLNYIGVTHDLII